VWPSRLKGILKPHNMVKNCKWSTWTWSWSGVGTKRWELRRDRKLTSSNPVKGRAAPRLCRVLWKSENFHLQYSVPAT
jgi:hypothetical protein